MKKAIAILLLLTMLVGMSAIPAAADDTPAFVVSTAEAAPGDEVTLTVSMVNNPGIAAFGLIFEYDEDVLDWTSVTKGNISSGMWDVGVNETEIWFDADNFYEDVVILNLTFTVKEDAPAGTSVVTLSYDPEDVCDEDLENVYFAVIAGGVTVMGTEHTHSLTATTANAATCTEAGNSAYYYCAECGKYFGDAAGETEIAEYDWVIPALGHDYAAVVTAPTCTEQGYTTYTCTRCGDSYVDNYVDAAGHTPGDAVTENVVAATCEAAGGYESVVYCTVCNEELSRETVTVPALGHDWDNGFVTT